MADTLTTNIQITNQQAGGNNNTWGDVADANFERIDDLFGDLTAISTTGGDTTLLAGLVDPKEIVAGFSITGTLVSNANIIFSGRKGFWIIYNGTTGNFTVTAKLAASSGVSVPQGERIWIYCDGSEIYQVTAAQIAAAESDVVAAATTDVLGDSSDFVRITGTGGPITSFGTAANVRRFVRHSAAAVLTHNATSLILPTGANITTAAGDSYIVISDASGNARVLAYQKADGTPLTVASTTEALTGTDTAKPLTANALAALWEQGSDIPSADPLSIGEGGYFHVTGTTGITDIDFATDKAGRAAILVFDDALTLTHSATLILPGSANITTAAGDAALVVSEGSDVVRVVAFKRAAAANARTDLGLGTAAVAGLLDEDDMASDSDVDVPSQQSVKAYVDGKSVLEAMLATTSGTTKTFSGILAGAKRITVMFDQVSLTSGDNILVQIGDSGGIEATGYVSGSGTSSGNSNATSGFVMRVGAGSDTICGMMVLELMDAATNLWVATHGAVQSASGSSISGGGSKALSGVLDRIRITRDGTASFDGGNVNIRVEYGD